MLPPSTAAAAASTAASTAAVTAGGSQDCDSNGTDGHLTVRQPGDDRLADLAKVKLLSGKMYHRILPSGRAVLRILSKIIRIRCQDFVANSDSDPRPKTYNMK